MEIEHDVSRVAGSVELDAHDQYQPRPAHGSVWANTVATANFAVLHGSLGRRKKAAPRTRRGGLG